MNVANRLNIYISVGVGSVVMGGAMVTSPLMSLFVIPAIYLVLIAAETGLETQRSSARGGMG